MKVISGQTPRRSGTNFTQGEILYFHIKVYKKHSEENKRTEKHREKKEKRKPLQWHIRMEDDESGGGQRGILKSSPLVLMQETTSAEGGGGRVTTHPGSEGGIEAECVG